MLILLILIKKIDGCANNPENNQQKFESKFVVDIQCQLYGL